MAGPLPIPTSNGKWRPRAPTRSAARPAIRPWQYKLETLRALIDNEILLQRAEKAGLIAVDADVEAKFNQLRAPYTEEDFQKQLKLRQHVGSRLQGAVTQGPEH